MPGYILHAVAPRAGQILDTSSWTAAAIRAPARAVSKQSLDNLHRSYTSYCIVAVPLRRPLAPTVVVGAAAAAAVAAAVAAVLLLLFQLHWFAVSQE